MKYIRDLTTVDEFNEEYLKPFIANINNDFRRKFMDDIMNKFPNLPKDILNFILKYK